MWEGGASAGVRVCCCDQGGAKSDGLVDTIYSVLWLVVGGCGCGAVCPALLLLYGRLIEPLVDELSGVSSCSSSQTRRIPTDPPNMISLCLAITGTRSQKSPLRLVLLLSVNITSPFSTLHTQEALHIQL